MSKIKKLDVRLSNMIAAGEVVERPAGIIKELIENSIDAQSTRIVVEIEEGGISYLKVEDNGIGMDKEDSLLAFERHATSKISKEKDLFSISTLGFRGEALPSIASVSDVKMTTHNGEIGTQIHIKYGELLENITISRNQGTTIEVRKLFQNTPARLKHLKNVYYESSRVGDVVKKFACSYPQISFVFVSEGRKIFESNGNNKIQDVLLQLYEYEVLKDLILHTEKNSDFELQLYLAQPSYTRKNNSILIYINRRMIRSYSIQKAIIEGYAQYIPNDRMPIVVLNINMDYSLVDVNVHPSKMEVRVSKEQELLQFISETISKCLKKDYHIPNTKPIEKINYESLKMDLTYEIKEEVKPVLLTKEPIKILEEEKAEEIQPTQSKIVSTEQIQEDKPQNIFHKLKVLSQLSGKYILCESEEGLYIVDQHAAAERVNYEKIQAIVLKNEISQIELVPFIVKIPLEAIQRTQEIIDSLKELHIELELFSDNQFVVRSVPNWAKSDNEKQLIQDLIFKVVNNEKIDLKELRKYAIATAACHTSIRFNRHLSLVEMQSLIRELANCDHPYHCPHGRTVMILIDHLRLEKDFMRVGV